MLHCWHVLLYTLSRWGSRAHFLCCFREPRFLWKSHTIQFKIYLIPLNCAPKKREDLGLYRYLALFLSNKKTNTLKIEYSILGRPHFFSQKILLSAAGQIQTWAQDISSHVPRGQSLPSPAEDEVWRPLRHLLLLQQLDSVERSVHCAHLLQHLWKRNENKTRAVKNW